ncbi:MAG TPA: DnaB-like helicase C-terminal domain-containing protein [Terracidiphilus sp.]|nr:DnaB-like helicase C-terminal domain-containing protein [Terracidiphilus sp.]
MTTYLPETTRLLPQSPDAGQAALCCFLLSPRDVGALCAERGVDATWFHIPAHATIYGDLAESWSAGKPIDLITLTTSLRAKGKLDECGGAAYVTELFCVVPTAALAGHYLDILNEHRLRREIIAHGTDLSSRAYELTEDLPALIGEAVEWSAKIGTRKDAAKTSVKEHFMDLMDELSGAVPEDTILSGLDKLDDLTGGWQRGNLVVISAETKGGKSALLLNIIENNVIRGDRTAALFSLEMSGKENAARLLSSVAEVNGMSIRGRQGLVQGDMDRILTAQNRICEAPLDIITDARTLPELTARAMQLNAKRHLDIIGLDYIQLLGGISKDGDSREREVSSVSHGMKALAERLGCVVIALSQLNDKGLLRESRAIGQDANCVLGIEAQPNEPGVKFIRVCAQRSGPSGDAVAVSWRPGYTQFRNLDPSHKKYAE